MRHDGFGRRHAARANAARANAARVGHAIRCYDHAHVAHLVDPLLHAVVRLRGHSDRLHRRMVTVSAVHIYPNTNILVEVHINIDIDIAIHAHHFDLRGHIVLDGVVH